ncbi:glucokinase [Streptosporangium becharense]|uniref:Glucokinase n=1 Tax=Streptosporangium becharense TaxID=1816182 RepID=A0A7W9MJ94_9ACTN|nr:ROK family protein [Streptosporangium becharense]MBB2910274.1 glucokinase [Streptosporangium becharense]MBB5823017.1 glucokinase [Streptosporangium becharense]
MTIPSYRVGIDLGATSTKVVVAVSGDDGTLAVDAVVDRFTFPTPRGSDPVDRLASHLARVARRPIGAGGVTVPGILDEDSGRVLRSVNLPWLDGADLGSALGRRLGFPVRAVHDGRAAAEAEALLGAGRGFADAFVLALGTGIAGAHVEGRRARRGAHAAAGEVGHISQDPDGRLCGCGQHGCLETFIGGTHLASRWSSHTGRPATARDLFEAGHAGDPAALTMIDEATTALARCVLGVIATLDPSAIIIGGGISGARDLIVTPTARKVYEAATFHARPPILSAELGRWAGAWGAVLAAGCPSPEEITCG